MKKKFSLIILSALLFSGCSKNFESINKSPDLAETPTLDNYLPTIELTMIDWAYYTSLTIIGQVMYQVGNYGTNFNNLTIGTNKDYHFTIQYSNAVKNLVDFTDRTKDSKDLINYNCVGRILKAYAFHQLTDVYGDIPYFNAGKGFIDRNFQPEYDDQKLIYEDMLKELKDAAEKLDKTKPLNAKADVVYKGDTDKWKKFAYSFMLRLALRIYKADPANSAKWISTAINGGLFTGNSDNFVVFYKPNTYYATISNGWPTPFIYYDSWKLSEPFVENLKTNNDPRIYIYSVLPNGDTTASKQLGVPAFSPTNDVPRPLKEYSVSPKATFGKYDAPYMHLSYAQVLFMLSEISLKGIVPELKKEDASKYYADGIRSAMKQLEIYGGNYKIPNEAMEKYVSEQTLSTSNPEMAQEQINTQYWIESHYNFYETYANWRRSGYPKFDESVNVIPRRLPYPNTEANINGDNIKKAIERQGPDLTTTKVWWDK